jgi:hypothetical protein
LNFRSISHGSSRNLSHSTHLVFARSFVVISSRSAQPLSRIVTITATNLAP